jgi:hypothetical protein
MIAFQFDVLHENDQPIAGMREVVQHVVKSGQPVVILTTRDVESVERWLDTWGYPYLPVFNTVLPIAPNLIVDDRIFTVNEGLTEVLQRPGVPESFAVHLVQRAHKVSARP